MNEEVKKILNVNKILDLFVGHETRFGENIEHRMMKFKNQKLFILLIILN